MPTKPNHHSPPAAKPAPVADTAGHPEATTPPKAAPLPPPTIPLTPDALAAYKALNAQYEATLQATDDVGVLQGITASQLDVRNILTKDTMYRLTASAALYDALLTQINCTNKDLAALRKQIAAIAADIATSTTILAAIDHVLKVVPIP